MSAGESPGTPAGWRRLVDALRPRASRGQAVVAALCALLGFAVVTSVHTNRTPAGLAAARQEDLVRILDGLNGRADRLRQQADRLQQAQDRLSTSRDQAQVALDEARRQAAALGVLAGTLPATGPGVVLTIEDPRRQVTADTLLDAVEELRDAGAEAMQIGGVRVVASTYFLDAGAGAIDVSGSTLTPPYRILAIGDTHTLADALRIPGGVVDTVASRAGARSVIETPGTVQVVALQSPVPPRYARPSPATGGSSGS